MTDLLNGSLRKIEWADQHIRDLNAAWAMFLVNGGPCDIFINKDIYRGDLVFTFCNIRPLPDELSLLTGDVLNGLRSALDYLASALVIAAGNEPNRRTGFPIFIDFDKYKSMSPGMVKGVSSSAQTLIAALQPFNPGLGENHPLWMLHELNNTDKHKLLIPIAGQGGWGALGIGGGKPGQEINVSMSAKFATPIKDGAEIMRLHSVTPGAYVNPQFSYQVVLPQVGCPKYQSAIPTLQQLSDTIKAIVTEFRSEFS